MYKLFIYIVVVIFLLVISPKVFASEYALPYPGLMPGHPLYKATEFVDRLQEWWSFGSFAKFKYYLSISDKKLVETKTLFEYKQFLLGYEALKKSERYFDDALLAFEAADKEKKDISQKKEILRNAAIKHIGVLNLLQTQVPQSFIWQPEKGKPSVLPLKDSLNGSRKQRERAL